MEDVLNMAGYFAAHAIWSIENGEVLIPMLAFRGTNGRNSMERLMMDSDTAFALAERRLASPGADKTGAVFIRDAVVTLETEMSNALVVDIGFALEGEVRMRISIPYKPAQHPHRFAVYAPRVVPDGSRPERDIQRLMGAFVAGIHSHEQGGKLYREHLVTDVGEGPDSPQAAKSVIRVVRRWGEMLFRRVLGLFWAWRYRRDISEVLGIVEEIYSAMPPVYRAVARGSAQDLRLAIAAGASMEETYLDETPLLRAVSQGEPELVSILLAAGADPNGCAEPTHPPIILAVTDRPDLVELLIRGGANPDFQGEEGDFALGLAASRNLLPLARTCLEHGANPNLKDLDGRTPLGIAQMKGYKEMAELLRSAGGVET